MGQPKWGIPSGHGAQQGEEHGKGRRLGPHIDPALQQSGISTNGACFAPDATFVDLSQGLTASGRDKILAYGHRRITAISDACYANTRITEASGPVTLQSDGQGVNDGPFGSFPATGKRVSFPIFNVIAVNDDGQIARMEQLYDRLDILIKLGHMPPG